MRITNVDIENFRGIRSASLSIDAHVTVLIGRNGVGKTAVLDATALLLRPFLALWPPLGANRIHSEADINEADVRIGSDDAHLSMDVCFNHAPPTFKNLKSSILFSEGKGQRNSKNSTYSSISNYIHNSGFEPERPLFVHYSQDRGFDSNSRSRDVMDRNDAWYLSLVAKPNAIRDLETWWDLRDADEARNVRDADPLFRDPQLEAIRAIIKEIDGYTGLTYSSTSRPPGLYLRKISGGSVHISRLSSGERSYIILLADLARRLQLLAPDQKLDQILGIVLIDEIELNLHPVWQSRIIGTLRRAFSRCQFIITTWSAP